jgi:hypothetical protein
MRSIFHYAPCRMMPPHKQQGAVLIVSMVLLVVLTLLGVSVMNMTQLEERMASNMQEVTQAFQSAETGLSQGYADDDVWNPTTDTSEALAPIPSTIGRTDSAGYDVEFITATAPPFGFDVSQYQTANFDFRGEGESSSGYTTILHGGGYRVFRNAGFL